MKKAIKQRPTRRPCMVIIMVMILASSAIPVHGATGNVWPGLSWEQVKPEQVGMDANVLQRARDYALTGGGSGCITRHGGLVMQWGDQAQRYDLKSSTKAIEPFIGPIVLSVKEKI